MIKHFPLSNRPEHVILSARFWPPGRWAGQPAGLAIGASRPLARQPAGRLAGASRQASRLASWRRPAGGRRPLALTGRRPAGTLAGGLCRNWLDGWSCRNG